MNRTLLLLPLLAACSHWSPVVYEARPIADESLADEFERLMMSTQGIHPVRVEVKPGFATFTYAYGQSVQTSSLTFGDVKRIDLLQKRDTFAVEMFDKKGDSMGYVVYDEKEKAQQMYDVLHALTQPGKKSVAAAPKSTSSM